MDAGSASACSSTRSASSRAAAAGHRTVLFEQFDFYNDRGSSDGDSRMFRVMYSDPNMARLAETAGFDSVVVAVEVVGDGSYQTAEGLHTATYDNGDILQGSTEGNVRAALGTPMREDNSVSPEFRRLIYKGLMVDVNDIGYVWRVVVK